MRGWRRARPGQYDFAFIDADKTGYLAYYERLMKLLRPGGLIVVDNTLWSGEVANPENREAETEALREFNDALHRDPRIDLALLPVGDGLTLARVRDEVEIGRASGRMIGLSEMGRPP